MPRNRDTPYGVEIRGPERGIPFVRPYRRVGELSEQELWKLERHPLDVADAVIERYSVEGAAAIQTVPGEVERLKWVGLYPQRQGGDAFMMRIKVPGGHLTAAQAQEIGAVAEAFAEGPDDSPVFGNRYADLTTRQDVQLHWLRIEDIPRIWQRFSDVGLTTIQACGDSSRNVTCCPVAGVDADEAFDALPVAREISDFFTGNREYANLPRKFKIAVTGCLEDCARIEINDIGLWPGRADDGTVGFNVLVGGGLSDGERMASDIDAFVTPGQALELTKAIARVYAELGNRENRGLARMRYLVQELGPEGFRAEVAGRLRFELAPAGQDLTRRFRGDHVGVHPQRQPGLMYVGCCVPVGRMRGRELSEAGRLAEAYGDGTLRIGTDQNLVLTGVPESRVDELLAEPLLQRYSPQPGPFTRGVMACTGSEFCRFAVIETKERAVRWASALDAAVAREDGDPSGGGPRGAVPSARDDRGVIRLHVSGRSASCAQPQIADIGFRGEVAHRDQYLSEAVDIGVGGSLGPDAAFIDWVAGRLPVDEVPGALGRVLERYRGERRPDEPFYAWARRTPGEEVRRALEGTSAGGDDRPGARSAADEAAAEGRADLASARAARSQGSTGSTR
jgi:ferredoxin-nitrite reductase